MQMMPHCIPSSDQKKSSSSLSSADAVSSIEKSTHAQKPRIVFLGCELRKHFPNHFTAIYKLNDFLLCCCKKENTRIYLMVPRTDMEWFSGWLVGCLPSLWADFNFSTRIFVCLKTTIKKIHGKWSIRALHASSESVRQPTTCLQHPGCL